MLHCRSNSSLLQATEGSHYSAANLAKFHHAICEIPRRYYSQIPYILQPVGTVVLTDNTSKYKEFLVTCDTKTHYVRPLMMKILSQCQKRLLLLKRTQHNEHADYLVSSFDEGARAQKELTTTRFCCINGKIKNETEKP